MSTASRSFGPGRATAVAHANIALIKYWGKADETLVLPRTSSLSLTLDGLATTTTVTFTGARSDSLSLDGEEQSGEALRRVSRFLDIVRGLAGIEQHAQVDSRNDGPTAAGLASSASGFAALALAASAAAGLELSSRELSRLARRGSGSACRSIFGGLVVWRAGHDDLSSFAEPLDCPIPLAVLVAQVNAGRKAISSREAMRRTVASSPLYEAWVQRSAVDLEDALSALRAGDLGAAGTIFEGNALGMHATMISARPAIVYWEPDTVRVLDAVHRARDAGLPVWATMDAGPNVKVVTSAELATEAAAWLSTRLENIPVSVNCCGPAARLISEDERG
ncbi:diphosphomevalonate decarboxylase [Propionibacterium cyclohexanicum]|uniref:diphosphomevalonate decarboxylase n=1 Tax=Propionibacterium cyclohexanicum TaxID=64702 RepID=A0A1H9PZK7_9ACTN|nr:diphosphomevalonate decarboxylase [Propionibacterium cyclohexanicum]SER53647.1 diphosphomevalonate decarboxylase [Propionibacterium cyclohexanicum]